MHTHQCSTVNGDRPCDCSQSSSSALVNRAATPAGRTQHAVNFDPGCSKPVYFINYACCYQHPTRHPSPTAPWPPHLKRLSRCRTSCMTSGIQAMPPQEASSRDLMPSSCIQPTRPCLRVSVKARVDPGPLPLPCADQACVAYTCSGIHMQTCTGHTPQLVLQCLHPLMVAFTLPHRTIHPCTTQPES
jgi:hypothetical protein